jgi:hypothetical protein
VNGELNRQNGAPLSTDWDAVLREKVLSDNRVEREAFLEKHGTRVRPILADLATFYRSFDERLSSWPDTERTRVCGHFLLAVGNTLTTSTHLLISGFALPSGHLMRQHAEAVAMSLMCATPDCRVFEAYSKDPSTFPVHKAVKRLTQKSVGSAIERHLQISRKAWGNFAEVVSFLDEFSHTGVVAMGHHIRFGARSGGIVIGAAYDPKKFKHYRQHLGYLRSASRNLDFLLRKIADGLRRAAV